MFASKSFLETPEDISQRHLERCLRLFLSADIVGSTAYKNKRPVEGISGKSSRRVQPWLETFNRFFEDLPFAYRNLYQGNDSSENLAAPRFWKTLGDEIVFETVLGSRTEAATHLMRFCETLQGYRSILQEADEDLDIKGTAWLAGFPVGNSVVYLSDAGSEDEWEDFIGPSMDIGFRLKDFANPRRIAVSVELAYMLASGEGQMDSGDCDLPLHLADAHSLKGVIQNVPYPAFWLECDSKTEADELIDLEKPLRATAGRAATKIFCEKFILRHSPPLFLPFIAGDPGFSNLPPGYDEDFAKISKVWEDRYASKSEPELDPQGDDETAGESNDRLWEIFREVFGETKHPNSD